MVHVFVVVRSNLQPSVRAMRLLHTRVLLAANTHNCSSSAHACSAPLPDGSKVEISGKLYPRDDWTNVTPHIASLVGRNLHNTSGHPINLLKRRVFDFFHSAYRNARGNPVFSAHDNLHPVVKTVDNFDSLLIEEGHVSRAKKDNYYVNKDLLLRSHTSAHQAELLRMGCDDFLIAGDVYRRDEVDSTHYPVFHQIEGLRTFPKDFVAEKTRCPVFRPPDDPLGRTSRSQELHSEPAAAFVEADLKKCLGSLCDFVLGSGVERRWVDAYFPFTHPSWELEVKWPGKDDWVEMLGCGVIEQKILQNAGVGEDRIGWAFGLGLERWAMKLYSIPDIRLFWTSDSGFLNQFKGKSPEEKIVYKPISIYPQCRNDISFWLPESDEQPDAPPSSNGFESNDFYDLVRSLGKDMVEQVILIDEFYHPKRKRKSQTYSIVYRSMTRTLTQEEVNEVHKAIEKAVAEKFRVTIR